ncbi:MULTISPECIES: VOC family protein [Providencia]|uniref:VOC family protein n=1 Tax=Providencia TaxID=586 RepID=UPI00197FBF9F|nr:MULTISPECIES: VOC family protein [Providencia]MBN4865189.1 VOC family protein [Providencia stuartii]MBN4874585.1 VOC family protein [Providencia stuartii]MBN4879202.1 VOC family protein [Providencia stuartii]MBN4883786.1 VOC family protein [Providencia stuartii]HEM8291198.1 VOC family protein [Providencia stuartii]
MLDLHDSSDVLFIAGFGPVVADFEKSQHFYLDVLGLPLKPIENGSEYLICEPEHLDGVKHFALWPLNQAAQSCFNKDQWPADIPIPQSWMEFEVSDIEKVTQTCQEHGYQLLVNNQMEPWGQTVTRLLSPEGMLVGLTITPWLRE